MIDLATDLDFEAVQGEVRSLLLDVERLSSMSPFDHLRWSEQLPTCAGFARPPKHLETATLCSEKMPTQELHDFRLAAKRHWAERKRMLDLVWPDIAAGLPAHVRQVIGPKKNLLVLAELLDAAAAPKGHVIC